MLGHVLDKKMQSQIAQGPGIAVNRPYWQPKAKVMPADRPATTQLQPLKTGRPGNKGTSDLLILLSCLLPLVMNLGSPV